MGMDSTDSSTGSELPPPPPPQPNLPPPPPQPNLPPGFRFHPTDEELVVHYLKRKAVSDPLPVAVVADVDLYKFDPWELPAKATYGDQEWYFFSPRERKYPNGARPNRAATSGYWKATGTDKPVLSSANRQKVGVKKALVFYGGKPPKGIKTNWIMHEYRLADNKPSSNKPGYDIPNKNSLKLDDWVLCRIYKKSNANRAMDQEKDDPTEEMGTYSIHGGGSRHIGHHQINAKMPLPKAASFGWWHQNDQNGTLEGMVSHDPTISHQVGPSGSKAALPLVLAWNQENISDQSQIKKFHADHDSGNGGSMSSLLSQLPQTPAVMGSLGDGVLRSPYHPMPDMNWFP